MQPTLATDSATQRDALKNLFFVVAAIGTAYWLIVSVGVEGLRQFVDKTGVWGPVMIVVFKMATLIVVPLSGGPVYAIAGAAFGFWKGFLLTFVGDVLGFTAAFYLSRFFGRNVLDFFVPSSQFPLVDTLLAQGSVVKSFLKARLAFAGFPEVFAYAAGLTTIHYLIFISAQMVIHTPTAALIVLFGDALLTENPVYFAVVTVSGLVLAVVGGWWFKRDLVREA